MIRENGYKMALHYHFIDNLQLVSIELNIYMMHDLVRSHSSVCGAVAASFSDLAMEKTNGPISRQNQMTVFPDKFGWQIPDK